MTISSQSRKAGPFTGNGSTTAFPFAFKVFAASDVYVVRANTSGVETVLTSGTDYNVTLNTNQNSNPGGTVTLTSALASNFKLVITSSVPNLQPVDITNNGGFYPKVINDALDRVTIMVQQTALDASRGIKVPITSSLTSDEFTDQLFDARDEAVASASSAATSATAAANSATSASGSATTATTKASEASTSAASASSSATAAAGSATAAAGSATTAGTSATTATNKANEAASSATAAAASATAAAGSATTATNKAGEATTAAAAAAGSQTAAAASASAAGTSATNASNSATSASNSATSAASSASSASTSASSALSSATSATASAATATTKASEASTSATNAASSASSASTSASTATTQATAAAASATAAAASYDNFDDRYLGAKASAPSLDNDGNALIDGALYFDSTIGAMRVYRLATTAWSTIQQGITDTDPVRPTIRPSLLLDFANTKQLDSRITFTRASTATYYDGKTAAMAEQNLVPFSQEFDNAGWSKQNTSVTANSTAAPDGTTTADTLVENTANAVHNIRYFNYTVLPLTTYVASVYVKANGRSIVYIDMTRVGVTNHRTWFDLSGAGSVLTSDAANTGAITSVGNGWYRISVTRTTVSGQTAQTFEFGPATADNTVTYTGDGTSGIFLWGAQLEQRSALTAYTPTTTAAITNYIPALQTAASGVARFDNNPTTGESLGLLIEEQRTNLLTYSDQFDNAAWTKSNATLTANAAVAPDGTLTMDLVVPTTASSLHYAQQTPTLAYSTTYTTSVFAKAGGYNWLAVEVATGTTFLYANVDLSTGALGTVQAGLTVSVTPSGNGVYRVSVTFTTAASGTPRTAFFVNQANGTNTHTGNGYSGIFIWGAQLEAGAFATSYIPTVASQVTRAADVASMTGTNFSSWYNLNEGSFYVDFLTNWGGLTTPLTTAMILSGQDLSLRFNYIPVGSNYINSYDGTNVEVLTSSVVGIPVKVATALSNSSSSAIAAFGGALGTSRPFTKTNAATALGIGALAIGGNQMNGTIKKIAYYPARVTNAQLQGMTTV